MTTSHNFVFIVLRYVMDENTNTYWIKCCESIRKYYPNVKIIIIDNNSKKEFLSTEHNITNLEIINSEYPLAGELLPYYYFYKYKFAENAVFIHDNVFVEKHVDLVNINDDVLFLWHHKHNWDEYKREKILLDCLNNSNELIQIYKNTNKWNICFGSMSYINHNFLSQLQNKYNFFNLLNCIKTKQNRCALERVFGLLCCIEYPTLLTKLSLFGIGLFKDTDYPFKKIFLKSHR